MSSAGMMRPFVVAAFFYDGQAAYHLLATQESVSIDAATGVVVSRYYTEMGGKLPVMATAALEINRDSLNRGLALLDAIDAAEKAEGDKVVKIVPPAEYPTQELLPPDGAA